MAEWRTTTLGDLCESGGGGIQTGPFGSQLHAEDYVVQGIPSVMPVNIGDNVIVVDDIARISEADADRLSRYRLRAGDIVYSRRGDVERRALVRTENDGWLCGTGCLRVRLGDEPQADPAFLSYRLGAEDARTWIVNHAVGATMPNLNTTILSRVPLTVPPMGEQRAIAEVLGSLDDKIAANTRLAHAAFGLARAHFDELTVGTSRPSSVGQVISLEYGKSLPASRRNVGDVLVYGSGGVTGTHDVALVDGPGVVVGRKGSAGAVHWSPGPHYPIDTTFYAVPRENWVSPQFAYFLLSSIGLNELNSDSAVPGLNRVEAERRKISLPPKEAIEHFTERVVPLMAIGDHANQEKLTLAATRDALLPALMSGKLRVRDAERTAAEVL